MGITYYGQHSGILLTSGFSAKNPVTISSNASIAGGASYSGDAIYGSHYDWTVANFGKVQGGPSSYGIALAAGGYVSNGSTESAAAVVAGVSIAGAAGTVVNFGTIDAAPRSGGSDTAIELSAGLVVNGTVGFGAAVIAGTIRGASTVTNFGTIGGVYGSSTNLVDNLGTIGSIFVNGVVNNQGLISLTFGGASVSNFGTIGSVLNAKTFENYGLVDLGVGSSGTVVNLGNIQSGCLAQTINNLGTIDGGPLRLPGRIAES